MEKYQIKLTDYAMGQMLEISTYISHMLHAPDSAKNLQQLIKKEMLSFSTMPNRMAIIEEEPWHSEGIRKTQVKNFYLYYWVDEKYNAVWFIAVIYARRNQVDELRKIQI